MWTARRTEPPNVDVAAERERVLARRAESFRQAEEGHLPAEEWSGAVERTLTLVPSEQAPKAEEQPMIKAAAGPKLTPGQRSRVKAFVRRELEQDPSASASAVRRRVEGELDINLNHATFHGTYWRKVKAELEGEASPQAGGADAAPSVIAPNENGAEPASPAPAFPAEQISMIPGADGQWRVQVRVTASRAQALRLMQAVVGVLAAEE